RVEKLKLNLPPEISVTPIGRDQTLSALLAAGELDAIYSAGEPVGFGALPQIGRLFEDFQSAETAYFRKTGIFPIMHVIAVNRALFEQRPWIARSLTKAFGAALDIAYADLAQRNALKVMLPWLAKHLDDTTSVLGPRY
ncbi:MAG: 4,5-dihydroxyphthalate decarboxylase, partial [Trebonia sp.]|nr:4,5-dihydroxyphthalate decarboxylase [Trebonia sp.]